MRINRRHFLLGSSLAVGAGLGFLPGLRRAGAQLPTAWSRKLINVTLEGGPDFRHLIVPPPNPDPTSYGYFYWKYRASAHQISDTNTSAWTSRYTNDYLPVTSINGTAVPEFGVLAKADWLHSEIVAGRVAIVSNVDFSRNRDHAHSLLILESGDLKTSSYQTSRDGWGGRLASAVSGNMFSMTRQRLLYCNLPTGSTSQIVSARDTRSFGLAQSSPTDWQQGSTAVSDRALTSYYYALRTEGTVPTTSPYYKFVHHEDLLRGFTSAVSARLGQNPVPADIAALYSGNMPVLATNRNFGEQVRDVYDCFACEDITDSGGNPFNFRVGSLDYSGWDTHRQQRTNMEPRLGEIFGSTGGLAVLKGALDASMPGATNNYVVTVAGEFGRQLRSNGDGGTDHGRGNYAFVIGNQVRGGVYGEMFPMAELTNLVNGQNKYERFNGDIEGLTSLSHVFGAVCDWVANNDTIGDVVFPSRATDITEAGVTMTRAALFTT